MNIGYWPGGTALHEVLEFGRQIERWSMLGLPLLVLLTVPSAATKDPLARYASQPLSYGAEGSISIETQRAWVEQYLPMLLSKQQVQAIIWNQLSDAVPHDFAHGGLFAADRKPKPVLESLRTLRRQFSI